MTDIVDAYQPPFIELLFVTVENGLVASSGSGSTDDMDILPLSELP